MKNSFKKEKKRKCEKSVKINLEKNVRGNWLLPHPIDTRRAKKQRERAKKNENYVNSKIIPEIDAETRVRDFSSRRR
jgi:chromatin segregation and condensation protein Rec8/ScpA/Scc1 (kleisin family)